MAECLNISNQSLVSSALAEKDTRYALSVVKRHLSFGVVVLALMGGMVMGFHEHVVGFFTPDRSVIATAWTALPLLALSFPLDAVAAITDGTLTAAGYASTRIAMLEHKFNFASCSMHGVHHVTLRCFGPLPASACTKAIS
jgi:Na+-driven multidrug efflux pump